MQKENSMFQDWDKISESKYSFKEKLKNQYKEVFGTVAGKTVLADILEVSGAFKTGATADTIDLAYKAGKKDMALRLLEILDISPVELLKK